MGVASARGYPAGTKRKAEEDKPPRERKAKAPRVKGGFAGLLDTLEADEKASLLAWRTSSSKTVPI